MKLVEGMVFTGEPSASSLSAVSGSIKQSFAALSSTFDVKQQNIADSLNLDRKLEYLKKIAESMEEWVKLSKEQRDKAERQRKEALEEAKKERNRFYVGVIIGIAGIVVGAIGLLALL